MSKRNNNWKDIKTKVYVCAVCNKEFVRSAYANYKYCSHKCSSVVLRGNQYAKGNGPNKTSFTSERVKGKNNVKWKDSLQFTCEFCKNVFERKPWRVAKMKNKTPRFCSRECFTKSGAFRAEKSTSYVGGKNTYRGRKWPEVRKIVVERDKGICQACNKFIGERIPVHHIIPFREFSTEEEANVLENLVCMCQSCHMKIEPRKPNSFVEGC